MAKIVVLFVLGLVIYLLIRRYFLKSNASSQRPTTPRDTVQCVQCKIYVPRDEAIAQNDQFFCCKQHARDWTPPG